MCDITEYEPLLEDFKKYSENLFNDENTNIFSEMREELQMEKKWRDVWERNNYPGRVDQAGHMKATGPG